MSTPLEFEILGIAKKSISEAIVKNLTEYSGPLRKLCEKVMSDNEPAMLNLINSEVSALFTSEQFRSELQMALNSKLARCLIERGEKVSNCA